VDKPSLGMEIEWRGDSAERMVVVSVELGGVADAGGVQAGYIITEIGGVAPVEFVRNAQRVGAVRVVAEYDGKTVVRYLEFPPAAPESAAATDLFREMFARKPEGRESATGIETELVAVSVNAGGVLDSPFLPRRDTDADRDELIKAYQRARERHPAPPPMGNLTRWYWID
jgi:hypothetical protein